MSSNHIPFPKKNQLFYGSANSSEGWSTGLISSNFPFCSPAINSLSCKILTLLAPSLHPAIDCSSTASLITACHFEPWTCYVAIRPPGFANREWSFCSHHVYGWVSITELSCIRLDGISAVGLMTTQGIPAICRASVMHRYLRALSAVKDNLWRTCYDGLMGLLGSSDLLPLLSKVSPPSNSSCSSLGLLMLLQKTCRMEEPNIKSLPNFYLLRRRVMLHGICLPPKRIQ